MLEPLGHAGRLAPGFKGEIPKQGDYFPVIDAGFPELAGGHRVSIPEIQFNWNKGGSGFVRGGYIHVCSAPEIHIIIVIFVMAIWSWFVCFHYATPPAPFLFSGRGGGLTLIDPPVSINPFFPFLARL